MKAAKLVSSVLLILMLSGCWGSRETDEIAYVIAIGFDKGPGKDLIMTFQIANPRTIAGQAGGGGGGDKSRPLITVSTIAKLPIGAFNLLNAELSRHFSLLHTRAFVFSEELAREGLQHYLAPLNRYREARGTAFIFISRGKASDFLAKNQPQLEITPAKQYDLVAAVRALHGLAPAVQFRQFYENTKTTSQEPVAPLVSINEKGLNTGETPEPNKLGDYLAGDLPSNKGQVQFIGTAVFKEDRMVGMLTGDETRYLNMITGELKQSFLIIQDPKASEEPLGMTLRQARKPVIKVRFTPERPVIVINIYQEPELVGVSSGINYENTKLKPVLEKALEDIIKRRCYELVTRTQEEFRSDIFGFGRYARMNFLTVDEWKKADWEKIYPYAGLDINVHVKIRRTGLMFKTRPVHF